MLQFHTALGNKGMIQVDVSSSLRPIKESHGNTAKEE